jgi:hypothetical protein
MAASLHLAARLSLSRLVFGAPLLGGDKRWLLGCVHLFSRDVRSSQRCLGSHAELSEQATDPHAAH